MLVRTRRKALEQMGKDSHVLLPSGAYPGNTCVCGQEIGVHEQLLQSQMRMAGDPSDALPVEGSPTEAVEGSKMPGMGEMGFNWDKWDSLLGHGTGRLA